MADDKSPTLFQSLMGMADAAVAAAVLIALGAWGGTWLDGHFNTRPWWTIGLSLTGALLGMVRMMMKALALNKTPSTQGTNSSAVSHSSKPGEDSKEDAEGKGQSS